MGHTQEHRTSTLLGFAAGLGGHVLMGCSCSIHSPFSPPLYVHKCYYRVPLRVRVRVFGRAPDRVRVRVRVQAQAVCIRCSG